MSRYSKLPFYIERYRSVLGFVWSVSPTIIITTFICVSQCGTPNPRCGVNCAPDLSIVYARPLWCNNHPDAIAICTVAPFSRNQPPTACPIHHVILRVANGHHSTVAILRSPFDSCDVIHIFTSHTSDTVDSPMLAETSRWRRALVERV